MIFGPDILVLKAALILAATAPSGKGAEDACLVETPPAVAVKVETADIVYDYGLTAQQLTAMKTDTVSPYAPGADSVSGGLREDKPEIKSLITWQLKHTPRKNIGCLAYNKIDITIKLSPKIYVAREFNAGSCREAILQHERHHVAVDRQVMNKYANIIGRSVQNAVNKAGALGPFPMDQQEKMKEISSLHIESAINSQILLMQKEMRQLQGQVDTLDEYKRVSSYCRDIKFPR